MRLNPPSQYADDRNLRARQALWQYQDLYFDLVAWVLDVAGVAPGSRVLDLGCGNGRYVAAMAARGIEAVGCDLSLGMLRAVPSPSPLVNADAVALPVSDASFDIVLAPHMLYHVEDRLTAAGELRRVTRPAGRCVVVTNGPGHLRSLRDLVETAVGSDGTPWEMRNPATHAFSLDNGAAVLRSAFTAVTCVRPDAAPVALRDADVAADYVASVGDLYQHEIARPWSEVVEEVRAAVGAVIARDGVFVVRGETGAFVCT